MSGRLTFAIKPRTEVVSMDSHETEQLQVKEVFDEKANLSSMA